MLLDANWMGMPMDWELSQFGLGESIDNETAIIALVAVLGFAVLGPLLAMGGRNRSGNDGGHPLRSKLYSRDRD
jgi:hypothetical protein